MWHIVPEWASFLILPLLRSFNKKCHFEIPNMHNGYLLDAYGPYDTDNAYFLTYFLISFLRNEVNVPFFVIMSNVMQNYML